MKWIARTVLFTLFVGSIAWGEKPINSSLQQLDLNGNFVLFMDTSTIEHRILDYVDTISETLLSLDPNSNSSEESKAVLAGINKVKAAIKWSGLLSLQSYAMSMAPAENGFDRAITVMRYAPGDEHKAFWRIFASEPAALKGIHYVPADAIYTINGTASLSETWKVLNEAVGTFLEPEQQTAFNQQIAMAQMLLGTNITTVANSLGNEILISIQFSETKKVALPQGISIPEPSLLIGLKTKNPLLGKIILEKIQQAQMPATETQHGAYTLHSLNLPIPAPFPVQPTLVQTEDYLLIASSPATLVSALESKAGKSGLVATPLYRKLLAKAPEKTSGIEFVSPRFMQLYLSVMKQGFATSTGEEQMMLERVLSNYETTCSGGYSLKTPNGIYSEMYGNFGGTNPAEMIATAYVGLVAAVAIPSFETARHNSINKACSNKLRIIDCAKDQWAMENGKSDGTPVTAADLSEYIKGGFSAKCPQGGTISINPIGTPPECSIHGHL